MSDTIEQLQAELAAAKAEYSALMRAADERLCDCDNTRPCGSLCSWCSDTRDTRIAKEAAKYNAELSHAKAIIAQHNLCHDLHGKVGPREFADGCSAEQRKIYGCAPDADAIEKMLQAGRDFHAGKLTADELIGELHRHSRRIVPDPVDIPPE